MEKESKRALIMIGIIVLIVVFLSVILPIRLGNSDCYKEIIKDTCLQENKTIGYYNQGSGLFGIESYFNCCEEEKNITSRKRIDNIILCEKYIFLEEDDKKCSKNYRFWKQID